MESAQKNTRRRPSLLEALLMISSALIIPLKTNEIPLQKSGSFDPCYTATITCKLQLRHRALNILHFMYVSSYVSSLFMWLSSDYCLVSIFAAFIYQVLQ